MNQFLLAIGAGLTLAGTVLHNHPKLWAAVGPLVDGLEEALGVPPTPPPAAPAAAANVPQPRPPALSVMAARPSAN